MAKLNRLLIVTRDDGCYEWVRDTMDRRGTQVVRVSDEVQIGKQIVKTNPGVVLLDVVSRNTLSKLFRRIRKIDAYLPVITLTENDNSQAVRLESLKQGAYGTLEKPLSDKEVFYYLVNNGVTGYREHREALETVAEWKQRCESDKLNLLELELVKSLQHMIGETEDPVTVFKHAFSLIKNYLSFDVFAALVPSNDQVEIYVYPNVAVGESTAENVVGALIKKMAKASEDEKKIILRMEHKSTTGTTLSHDLTSAIVPLSTSNRTYGYAGLYRSNPFVYHEEAVFKKFCAHISNALEKITLFGEIKTLSANDGLTGLLNHRAVVARLEQEVQRSQRYGSPLSILMFDIDDFKEVNDTFGHLAGDTVLAEVAARLQKGVRGIDSVGRYGGEEFLAILPETDDDAAMVIADRLREAVCGEIFRYDDSTIKVSVSGGVAAFRDGMDMDKMIRTADEHLYRAKKEGKNVVRNDND